MVTKKTEKVLMLILACLSITSALIGLLYRNGGDSSVVMNVFGDNVTLYGNGIYANNTIFTVANQFGANVIGIIGALFTVFLYLLRTKSKYIEILKFSVIVTAVYASFTATFNLAMNRLYLLYVATLGLSVFLAFNIGTRYFRNIKLGEDVKKKKSKGLYVCMIIFGIIITLIWLSRIIPSMINDNYSELLGLSTTEVTFAFDLGIICPALILCGVLISKKNEVGYKIAPLLLYVLVSVAPMVIAQNTFCTLMGIGAPIPQFIGMVLSFVVIGAISLVLLIQSMSMLEYKTEE